MLLLSTPFEDDNNRTFKLLLSIIYCIYHYNDGIEVTTIIPRSRTQDKEVNNRMFHLQNSHIISVHDGQTGSGASANRATAEYDEGLPESITNYLLVTFYGKK